MVQRRTVDLLPEIFRTDTNRKFLNATLDQLVQEPNFVRTQGYVGRRVGPGVNPSDYYVTEPTATRTNYQLEPAVAFLKPDTNTVEDAITYPGMIDALNLNGAQTQKQDRLFESEYYAWDPFCDLDKFNNYSQYYWLPAGPDSVDVATVAVPTSDSYDVTRNANDYEFSGLEGINPTIILARGGNYTFNVNQVGNKFWIQTDPGINGRIPVTPNISSRDVLGVENNGEDQGTVTFNVPLKNAQQFYYTLADIGTVDLVADGFKFTDINNVYVTEFLKKYPNGIDGITSLNNRTVIFTNRIVDAESGGWQITTQYDPLVRTVPNQVGGEISYDVTTQPYDDVPYNTITPVIISGSPDPLDGQPGSYDSIPFDQTTDIATPAQRYSIWQIQYIPDNDGQFYMRLTSITSVPELSKMTVLFGEQWSSTQWYKDASGYFEKIPLLTAVLDTLWYQDGSNPEIFGQIKLIDPGLNEPINIDDIVGSKNYTSPNGVKFINGLKVQFRGPTNPAQFQNQEYYVAGVGTGPGVDARVGFVDGEAYFGPYHVYNGQLMTGSKHDETIFQQNIYVELAESLANIGAGGPAGAPLPHEPQDGDILIGNGIKLIPVRDLLTPETYTKSETIPYDSTSYDSTPYDSSLNAPQVPDYLTIDRSSRDRNAWSRSNRWFHIDVIRYTAELNNQTAVLDNRFRGKRPIIEFRPNLHLWDFGTQSKNYVNIIDFAATDAFSNIRGTAGYSIDGYNLIDGSLIIFAADVDNQVRNKIWQVRFIDPDGNSNSPQVIDFVPIVDAEAKVYQTVVCLSGITQQGLSFWFDGVNWIRGQQKTSVNQAPLFDIYNATGKSFGDPVYYPSTNFRGSKLFSYALGGTDIQDEILGFSLKYLNIDNVGDIVFENSFYTDTFNYVRDKVGQVVNVSEGFVHQFFDRVSFTNLIGWQPAAAENRSRQVFRFEFDGTPLILDVPVVTESVFPALQIFVQGIFIDPAQYSYTITDTQTIITFQQQPVQGSVIEVQAISDVSSLVAYYEVPLNLENNPANLNSPQFTLGTIRTHYESIVQNLKTVRGPANGANNTGNLGNIIPYGNIIVQNSSPLLAAGPFLRKQQFELFNALKFNSQEYEKYKARLLDLASKGDFVNLTPTQTLDTVLQEISLGRTNLMPFYWSDMIPAGQTFIENTYTYSQISTATFDTVQTYDFNNANYLGLLVYLNGSLLTLNYQYTVGDGVPTITITVPLAVGDKIVIREYPSTFGSFVPNTPTKLGLYPAYKPEIYIDRSFTVPSPVIRGHDGSITLAFGDARDQILLEFETRIFNNLKVPQTIPLVAEDVVPGQFRTTDYSQVEINNILSTDFLSWVGWNKLDYTTQTYFSNNPFTYNYSQSADKLTNEPLLGNWRGIYNYFYDTTSPNTRPWEMLGFSQEPDWWQVQYGPPPYTAGNLVLWDDLAAGLVKDPIAPYVIPKYRRPNLASVIPSGVQGALLSPLDTVVGNFDATSFQRSWTFGDDGPVENAWRTSSSYPFAVMRLLALTKPAKFFSLFIDRDRYRYNTQLQQWLWDGRYRLDLENISPVYGNGTSKASYIDWIIDYNQQLGKDSSSALTQTLKNLDVRLTWRLAAFSDKRYLKLFTERSTPTSQNASLLLPDESYQILLYENTPFSQAVYSSVIVQVTDTGWSVLGYNSTQPYFEVFVSKTSGNFTVINAGGSTVRVSTEFTNEVVQIPYGYVFTTRQSLCDFLVNYGRYLEAQGFTFEGRENGYIMNWTQMAQEFLYWSNQGWAPGSLINLNPGATRISVTRPGAVAQSTLPPTIDNIILNQNRQPLSPNNLVIDRFDNTFRITSLTSDTINYLKLRFTAFENLIVIDNVSIFADLIYDPITGARQSRIRAAGWVSGDWNGTVNAPGFILNQNNIQPWKNNVKYAKGEIVLFKDQYWVASTIIQPSEEFDYSLWVASDYNKIMKGLLPNAANDSDQLAQAYSVYNANLEVETDLFAYGLIGFRPREYMQNLNLDDVSQVNLYQQFLGTKGTVRSAEIFSFANLGKEVAEYNIFEYWAILRSTYGANANRSYYELLLNQALLPSDPSLIQVIQPGQSSQADQTVFVENIWKSSYKINSPDIMPTVIPRPDAESLPTAGYVNFNDVNFTAFDLEIEGTLDNVIDQLGVGSTIWVAKSNAYDWNVYRCQRVPGNIIEASDNLQGLAQVTFTAQHGLVPGDFVLIRFFDDRLNGSYRVLSVPTLYTILIDYQFGDQETTYVGDGVGFTLDTSRVAQAADIPDLAYANQLVPGARVWIDNNGHSRWTVLEKRNPFSLLPNIEPLLPEEGSEFGASLAQGFQNISALFGAPGYNPNALSSAPGAVYAFVKDDQNLYQEKVIITLSATDAKGYGNALDIGDQSWAVAGASRSRNNQGYATVIFNNPGSDVFEQRQLLVAPDQEFSAIEFGYSVAISKDENWMFIGAPGGSIHRPGGQVYVFSKVDAQEQIVTYLADGETRLFNWSDHIKITPGQYSQFVVVVNNQIQTEGNQYIISGSNVLFPIPPLAGQEVIITRRTGIQLDQELYTSIPADSTSGVGTGALFTINRVRGQYNVDLISGGQSYVIGNTLTFLATTIGGGTVPANNLTITVTSIGTGGTITGWTQSGSGVSNTSIFALDTYLATATNIFSFIVTVNNQIYRPFIDYDFNADSALNNYDIVFNTIPPAAADIRVTAKSYFDFVDVLSVPTLSPGARFGESVATSTDGRQVLIGTPRTANAQGRVYVFDRSVQRYQISDPTITTFTTVETLLSPTYVYLNGTSLVNTELNVGGQFTVDSSNQVSVTADLAVGDILEIETNQWTLLQTIASDAPFDSAEFGSHVDMCSNNCSLYIGAPNDSSITIQAGLVEFWQNQTRVYGTVTSEIANPTLTPGDYIRINNYFLQCTGTTVEDFVQDFNSASIPNVSVTLTPNLEIIANGISTVYDVGDIYSQAASYTPVVYLSGVLQTNGVDYTYNNTTQQLTFTAPPGGNKIITVVSGRVIFTVKNFASAPVFDKLTILPGTGTLLDDLGLTIYVWAQTITSPVPQVGAHFGSNVYISDTATTLVVSAPEGTAIKPVTFDSGTTYFDARSTTFVDLVTQSGVVYTYDYLPAVNPSVQNPGQFVFGQQIFNDNVASLDKFGSSIDLTTGTLLVGYPGADDLDSQANFGQVAQFVNIGRKPAWQPIRLQTPVVDVNLLNSVFMYDRVSGKPREYFDFFDPLQGKLLGSVQRNIDYIGAVDPANYNVGNVNNRGQRWGSVNLGQIWWDTARVRFIDPNQDDEIYASRRWGQVFPGSEIDVYQWITSDVPPAQYTGPGVPYSLTSFVVSSALNTQGLFSTVYFFWVSGINTVATNLGKTLSVQTIANYIEAPKSSGIPYIAPINSGTVAIYNGLPYISAQDTVLHVEFDQKPNNDAVHVEYQLIPAGKPEGFLTDALFNKFVDSFSGSNAVGFPVPDPFLPPSQQYGVSARPRQSFFVNRFLALENYLKQTNIVLAQFPIVEMRSFNLLNSSEPKPSASSGAWDKELANERELSYQNLAAVPLGYKYLVDSDASNNGLWTIYEVIAGPNQSQVLELIRVQNYDTRFYWFKKDWYRPGYDPLIRIVVEVPVRSSLDTINVPIGSSVKVTTNGQGLWEIYRLEPNNTWIRVGLQSGTIEFRDTLWDYNAGRYGFDVEVFDGQYFDQQPIIETRKIIEAINKELLIDDLLIERNNLLILMFNYILSEQQAPTWLTKTSLIDVDHTIRELEPFQIYRRDNQDFVLNYIQEVKPYHTQIRQFGLIYRGFDTYLGTVNDFDLPAYWDPVQNLFISPVLDNTGTLSTTSSFPSTAEIWQTFPYNQWFQNYLLSIESVTVIDGGSGYTIAPDVVVTGDCERQAVMTARVNSAGQVIEITVVDAGAGYSTTALISLVGGNGSGARAVAVMGNSLVRDICTFIKYDRCQYTSDVQPWSATTVYAENQLVRYDDRVWSANADNTTSASFDPTDWTLVPAGSLSGVDRTSGYYVPDVNEPGLDLAQLMTGIDYPGVQVFGPLFSQNTGFDVGNYDINPFDNISYGPEGRPTYDPAILDAIYESPFVDPFLGTLPTSINVDGGAFVDTYSSHAPEELVPGAIFDTLDMRVFTTPGADWLGNGHGFPMISKNFTYDSTILGATELYYGDLLEFPTQLMLYNLTNGTRLNPGTDYTIDWVSEIVYVSDENSVSDGDIIVVDVYALGGGNQLYTNDYLGSDIGSVVVIPFETNLIEDIVVFANGNQVTNFTYSVYNGYSTQIVFNTPFSATDRVTITALGLMADGSTVGGWSDPITQYIIGDGSLSYTLTNSLQGTNVPNVIVNVNGVRARPYESAAYEGDGSSAQFYLPRRGGYSQGLIADNDVSVYFNNQALVLGVGFFLDPWDGVTPRSVTLAFTPPPGTSVLVVVRTAAQYFITGDQITFRPSQGLSPAVGDVIAVTTWNDTSEQSLLTQVFVGPETQGSQVSQGYDTTTFDEGTANFDPGSYDYGVGIITQVNRFETGNIQTDPNRLIVTLNGNYLFNNEGFIVDGSIVEILGPVLSPIDIVVITSMTQSVVPGEIAFRIFQDMRGLQLTYRITDATTTSLALPLSATDDVIYLTDASKVGAPNLPEGLFGQITINGERIAYRNRDTVTNTVSGLRRGIAGTGAADHAVNTPVYDISVGNLLNQEYQNRVVFDNFLANGVQTTFVAEDISVAYIDSTELIEAVEVYVGGIKQTSGYTITGADPVTVKFDTAPTNGYQVSIRISQGLSWYEPGPGTASNGIPLQEQDTIAARFIQGN